MSPPRAEGPALELRDLRLVEAILRRGSLGMAARELGRTPSALSHQLAELERRLGVPLFVRTPKRLVPTEAARRLGARAEAILTEARLAEREVAGALAPPAVLRLTTECYSCYAWLPPVLQAFRAAQPHVAVQVRADATLRPADALLADEVDVALVCSPERDRRLAYWPVFVDELVAVVAPDHAWARRAHVGAAALAAEDLIVAPVPNGQSRLAAELFAPRGLTPRSVTRIPHTEAILEMVRARLGVGILPRWSAATYLAAGLVRAVRITRAGLQRDWQAAVRGGPGTPAHVREFVALLAQQSPPVPREAGSHGAP
jgi:LysR family transcriptional regulator for metE and metH